jgi:competence protein ComEC
MVYRQTNIWNVLGASAFVLLAYNPLMLFDAGFQLSYAAVVGMAFFYPLLYKVSPILPYAWMDAGWKVLLVGVAAQIGTLPLSLYYFHQFPCYFWLAGWVVVSGGAVFLWGGAVLILLDIFMPIGAGYLGYLLYYLTFWMNKIIFLIQDLPGAVWSGIWLDPLEAILLYGAIASIGAMVVWRHNRWVFATVICLLLLMAAQVNRTLDRLQTKAVCVYAVKKAVLIDVFDRGKRITIAEGVSERQEQFAAQSHRWAMGVDHRAGRGIGAARDTASGNVLLQNGLLRVGGLRLAMIGPHSIMPDTTLPVHAIVLSGNPDIPLERCIHSYPGSVIVADASNAHRSVRQWKAWCTERGIRFHDVKKEGAWRIEER